MAVFSAALMAQCSRYDVAVAARLKSIRGIVELSPSRHHRPLPSLEPVVSLGSHDGIVPWLTFQTASTHYLMFQMAQSWLWIEVESHEVDWEPEDSQTTARDAAAHSGEGHRWPTIEGDDKGVDDGALELPDLARVAPSAPRASQRPLCTELMSAPARHSLVSCRAA